MVVDRCCGIIWAMPYYAVLAHGLMLSVNSLNAATTIVSVRFFTHPEINLRANKPSLLK
ncbi:MAG: hypothetical protein QNJ47_12395 [Nostocaceae cyanobacterium]|nr:hypothetical protein [Nostocaceae cyanobacterium]